MPKMKSHSGLKKRLKELVQENINVDMRMFHIYLITKLINRRNI